MATTVSVMLYLIPYMYNISVYVYSVLLLVLSRRVPFTSDKQLILV